MKRFACLIAAGAVGVAGCSSGDDVYIKSNTASSQSGLSCTLAAGEDVCLRNWDEIAPARRGEAITLLNNSAEFAGEAHEILGELDQTCSEILTKFEVDPPSVDAGATDAARVDAICGVAVATIQQRRSTPLSVDVKPGQCTSLSPPSCVSSDLPRVQCALPVVTIVADPNAGDGDRAIASLGSSFAHAGNAKARLKLLMDTASILVSAMEGGKALGLPDCLLTTVTSLVSTATGDAKEAAEISVELWSSLGVSDDGNVPTLPTGH